MLCDPSKSNKHRFSPKNIHPSSRGKVVRIKKRSTKGKFSQPFPSGNIIYLYVDRYVVVNFLSQVIFIFPL